MSLTRIQNNFDITLFFQRTPRNDANKQNIESKNRLFSKHPFEVFLVPKKLAKFLKKINVKESAVSKVKL